MSFIVDVDYFQSVSVVISKVQQHISTEEIYAELKVQFACGMKLTFGVSEQFVRVFLIGFPMEALGHEMSPRG